MTPITPTPDLCPEDCQKTQKMLKNTMNQGSTYDVLSTPTHISMFTAKPDYLGYIYRTNQTKQIPYRRVFTSGTLIWQPTFSYDLMSLLLWYIMMP